MDYHLQKQIIIVIVYLVIFFLIGYGVYWIWFRHIPTCGDGILNQKEEQIDCGGPCESCEIRTLKNIEIGWVKALSVRQGVYDLAAVIENPNPNYGAANLPYEFFLYDASGAIITSKQGSTFILPNKKTYIIEPAINIEQSIQDVKIVFGAPQWSKLQSGFEIDQFFIKDKQFNPIIDGNGFYQVSGIVENKSAFDYDRVNVNIVLYDANNNPIGINKTEIRTLVASEERYFLSKWFSEITGETARVDIVAETDVFKNDNFMKRFGILEKFKTY